MPNKQIFILQYGRTGNRIFQWMLALYFQRHVPEAIILCNTKDFLSNVGIELDQVDDINIYGHRCLVVDKHDVDIKNFLYHFQNDEKVTLLIKNLACRMDIFFPLRSYYRNMFISQSTRSMFYDGWDDSFLVINIRLEDILDKCVHPNYPPLPFHFYKWILQKTKLKPVFMGQLGDDRISNSLRSSFPEATFVCSQDAHTDFQRIRYSKHVLLSISTFAYLATFLSESCLSIHVPIYGFFDPEVRPDCRFVVEDPDNIYHYYHLPTLSWKATDEQISLITNLDANSTWKYPYEI